MIIPFTVTIFQLVLLIRPLVGFSFTSLPFSHHRPQEVCAATITTTSLYSSSTGTTDTFWNTLLDRFQGDFDNYAQVVQDRSDGLVPREGGGHEQIHCLLVPVTSLLSNTGSGRLAAFWFDGIPQRIFRFRYYQLEQKSDSSVDMKLYCLNPALEGQLRGIPDPMEWPQALKDFQNQQDNDDKGSDGSVVELLKKCDVQWTLELDPVQHAYAQEHNDQKEEPNTDTGIHAVMVYGQAIVDSTMMPGTKILIKDQLSLWEDQFWIHDRGFHPDSMDFIYGNQRGVPYKLERVTNIVDNDKPERQGVRPDLQWTMGPDWRTEEEYQAKLEVLGGGVSSQLNRGADAKEWSKWWQG